jgi:hypothetical protein
MGVESVQEPGVTFAGWVSGLGGEESGGGKPRGGAVDARAERLAPVTTMHNLGSRPLAATR